MCITLHIATPVSTYRSVLVPTYNYQYSYAYLYINWSRVLDIFAFGCFGTMYANNWQILAGQHNPVGLASVESKFFH